MPEDGNALARAIIERIRTSSPAVAALGVEIVASGPGSATLALDLRPDMLNAQGIGHGGVLFALADTTSACAALSRNRLAVTQHASMTYIEPARGGDRLVATAVERMRAGRSAIYDVEIKVGERVIALVRANFRILEGAVL